MLVCVTAGVCEEVIFRGFVLQYLAEGPLGMLGLPLWAALLLSSVIFGAVHEYQGVGGMLSVAVLGLIFGALFLITGNLLLPIILHALLDLRILLLVRDE